MVNWQKLCTPKNWGGLRLRSARLINQMALMKVGWNLIEDKEDLWVRTLKSKYRCGEELIPRIDKGRMGTTFWRGLCHSWPQVTNNLVWRVGDGSRVNCWTDNWVPTVGKLYEVVPRPLSLVESHLRVSRLRSDSGGWFLNDIEDLLPPYVIDKIKSVVPPILRMSMTRLRRGSLRMGNLQML